MSLMNPVQYTVIRQILMLFTMNSFVFTINVKLGRSCIAVLFYCFISVWFSGFIVLGTARACSASSMAGRRIAGGNKL